jgi:hypothetical protein
MPGQVQLVYDIPAGSILAKLFLVQAGDTGTILFEPIPRNQAAINHDVLRDQFYQGGITDSSPGNGNGCRLWHTNPWALDWFRDM